MVLLLQGSGPAPSLRPPLLMRIRAGVEGGDANISTGFQKHTFGKVNR